MTALATLLLAASTWLQAAAGDSLVTLEPVRWPDAAPGEAYEISVGPAQLLASADPVPPEWRRRRILYVTLYRFAGHRWLRLEEAFIGPRHRLRHGRFLSLDFYDLAHRMPGVATFEPGSVRWLDPVTFELVDGRTWTDRTGSSRPGPRLLRLRFRGDGTVAVTAR